MKSIPTLLEKPSGSQHKLSPILRAELNAQRFSITHPGTIKVNRAVNLYDRVVPHYCQMGWDKNKAPPTPTRFRVYHQCEVGRLCNIIPNIEYSHGGHVNAGLGYDPKKIIGAQAVLTLCHVEIRSHPDHDYTIIETETFLSQQRLRQLQALLLPLVRPLSSIRDLSEKDIGNYVYDITTVKKEKF